MYKFKIYTNVMYKFSKEKNSNEDREICLSCYSILLSKQCHSSWN